MEGASTDCCKFGIITAIILLYFCFRGRMAAEGKAVAVRVVGVLVGVLIVGASCGSAESGDSLAVVDSAAGGALAVAAPGDVPVGGMVAEDVPNEADAVLVLVGTSVDELSVRWDRGFAPNARGFRLSWRLRPTPDGQELVWWGADFDAGTSEYSIGGLTATTRNRQNEPGSVGVTHTVEIIERVSYRWRSNSDGGP